MNIEAMLEQLHRETQIFCPYCDKEYVPDYCDGDGDLVSYWAEDGPVEKYCCNCEKTFYVQESIRRTYTTSKTA